MTDALAEAQENKAVRVILLRGGDGNFTSGNDLEDFLKSPPKDDTAPVFQFLARISSSAAVIGRGAGPGDRCRRDDAAALRSGLRGYRDVLAAVHAARAVPEAASSALLPRLAGHQVAAEKLLLGEAFDALEAHRIGIVNRVLPAARLDAFAAKQLAALPAASLQCDETLLKDTAGWRHRRGWPRKRPLRHDARAGSARGDDGVLREAQAGFPSLLTDRRSRARRRRTAGALRIAIRPCRSRRGRFRGRS